MLTVDVDKRIDINIFMRSPWIAATSEVPTTPLGWYFLEIFVFMDSLESLLLSIKISENFIESFWRKLNFSDVEKFNGRYGLFEVDATRNGDGPDDDARWRANHSFWVDTFLIITRVFARIRTEDIEPKHSWDSELFFESICSVRILSVSRVIVVFDQPSPKKSKIQKHQTTNYWRGDKRKNWPSSRTIISQFKMCPSSRRITSGTWSPINIIKYINLTLQWRAELERQIYTYWFFFAQKIILAPLHIVR